MSGSRSDTTLDYVKAGLFIYLGFKIVSAIEAGQDFLTDNPADAGSSHVDCDYDPNNLTLPEIQYKTIADGIQSAIWNTGLFATHERDEIIAGGLMMMNNIDDIHKLICVYDVRGAKDAYSATMNLTASIESYLDNTWKYIVNDDYEDRGINFQWI